MKNTEEQLIDYLHSKNENKDGFEQNPEFEAVIEKNLEKIDWNKFKDGTKFKMQIFMARLFGGFGSKYWVEKIYKPNHVFKEYNPFSFDTSEDHIERNLEHIKWLAMQGRIKVTKY